LATFSAVPSPPGFFRPLKEALFPPCWGVVAVWPPLSHAGSFHGFQPLPPVKFSVFFSAWFRLPTIHVLHFQSAERQFFRCFRAVFPLFSPPPSLEPGSRSFFRGFFLGPTRPAAAPLLYQWPPRQSDFSPACLLRSFFLLRSPPPRKSDRSWGHVIFSPPCVGILTVIHSSALYL